MPNTPGQLRSAAEQAAQAWGDDSSLSFDTEEVTGSIPVSPTSLRRSEAGSRGRGPASRSFVISLPTRHAGVLRQELNKPGTEWP